MIHESEIRSKLVALLLTDSLSPPDFEDWLVEKSWNMHLDSSESAQRLVWAIEVRLAEFSSDDLSDAQLWDELYSLLLEDRRLALSGSGFRVSREGRLQVRSLFLSVGQSLELSLAV